MLTEGWNLGSGLPPHISAADSRGCGSPSQSQKGWKRSMTVFIREEGPLKCTGKEKTRTSASEAFRRTCPMSSSMTQEPSAQPPQPVQCAMHISEGWMTSASYPKALKQRSALEAIEEDTPDGFALPQTIRAFMPAGMPCAFIIPERVHFAMKLAEALKMRSDLDIRLRQLETRLTNNSKVQEGDAPSEDPASLLIELDEMTMDLENLIRRINDTNSRTKSKDGIPLTGLLAKRDVLTRKCEILQALLNSASSRTERRLSSEIRIMSTVNVKELRKKVDAISKEIRLTDNTIQELNWTTELI